MMLCAKNSPDGSCYLPALVVLMLAELRSVCAVGTICTLRAPLVPFIAPLLLY